MASIEQTQFKWPQSIHDFGPFLKKQKLLFAGAEIGCAECRSSLEFMGWGFKKLYLVDAWKHMRHQKGDSSNSQYWHNLNLRGCHEKLDQFNDKIVYLQGDSVLMAREVKDKSLGFVYIDANHSYDGALADLKAWTPKVKAGGIVAGHDFNHIYGVQEAVYKFAGEERRIVNVLPEKAIENQGFWFYVNDL